MFQWEVNSMGIKLKYAVNLPHEERKRLRKLIHKGVANTRTITRARVLLSADEGKTDREIYEALDLAVSTPYDIRKRYHTGGLGNALYDTPHPRRGRKLSGAQEAEVIAISCTKAPQGYSHWTLDLLTEEVQRRGIVIGRTAIWKILLRQEIKPWREKNVGYLSDYR
jgi:transposase